MAFINELVPEEQKNLLKANEQFRIPAGQFSEPYRWTVDRERGVFIIFMYGGMPPQGDDYIDPDHYAMSWRGHVIKFDAIQTAKGNRNDGVPLLIGR